MGIGAALLAGGVISGVGSLASGIVGSSAAQSAASAEEAAAQSSSQLQWNEFQQVQSNLQPYMTAGTTALSSLQGLTGTNAGGNPLTAPLTAPFQPTMSQLAATPGYQFTLGQGLQATQNSYAAQGLGSSGAALKGAANYAEGLASTTYQQQFQNYLGQNQQIYNMLGGLTQQGQAAATGAGGMGLQTAAQVGQNTLAAGQASAAGTVGSANAITGALGNIGASTNNTALMLALANSGMFGNINTGGGVASPFSTG